MKIEAWEPQIDQLSNHNRVIAVDLPGHGSSAPLTGEPDLPDFVAWFGEVVDEFGLGAINVVGHSMGALSATGMAATAPKRRIQEDSG